MRDGICCKCGEHTDVDDSCCGAGVIFEGGVAFPDEETKMNAYEPMENN